MTTKVSTKLTLKDILSRLTFTEACKLLGDDGKKLIKGGSLWDIKIQEDVYLGDDLFRLTLHDTPNAGDRTIVTMTPMADARRRLHVHCSSCDVVCEHRGAALALVLEENCSGRHSNSSANWWRSNLRLLRRLNWRRTCARGWKRASRTIPAAARGSPSRSPTGRRSINWRRLWRSFWSPERGPSNLKSR